MEEKSKIKFYGTRWCPDCSRAKRVLDKLGYKYESFDIDKDRKACKYIQDVNNGNRSVPTIIFPDGSKLVEPSNQQLTEKLEKLFNS